MNFRGSTKEIQLAWVFAEALAMSSIYLAK